jgi:hypothetical protein
MDNNFKNAFPEVLPEHPHRRLYILISLLVFVIVSGWIVINQIKGANTATIINKPNINTEDQRVAEFNSRLVSISESMKESNVGQVPLSDTELKRIAENMNKVKKK